MPHPQVAPPLSTLDLVAEVLAARRTVFTWVVVGTLVAVGFALLRPRKFESATTVMAAVPAGAESRLAGLASQFGLGDLAAARGGIAASPDLIVQLARSRVILDGILDDRLVPPHTDGASTVMEVVRPTGGANRASAALERALALRELRDLLTVTKNKTTGTATIAVATESPEVSVQIVRAVIRELNEAFLAMGREQASEERRFIAERLREREASLKESERQLASFLTANRDFRSSPALVFEYDRLQRVVTREQQVVTSLAESSEDAALRSARDTPALVILEPATLPVESLPRRRALIGLLGIVGGGLLGVLIVLARAGIAALDRSQREDWNRVRSELRLPVRT